ncbi:transporter [Aliivibrio fischeri]|uniref:transporter n=1 Tax=Aliivibrio fischeri TaxID=668 RepID=UPI0012D9775E|nr:transporter [Aliivibrio fischeri]MUK76580.1 transporter [Aliivibrio fischeri]
MRPQRGVFSVDALLYFAFSLVILMFIITTILSVLTDKRLASNLMQSVERIQQQSTTHYATQVLQSRCLPQSILSMEDIDAPDKDKLASYSVKYTQRAQPNSAPSGIDIDVTLLNKKDVGRVTQFLSFTRLDDTTFTFHYPLHNQLHDWQQLDVNNGCIK